MGLFYEVGIPDGQEVYLSFRNLLSSLSSSFKQL
jgi:hypothetical protein